MLIKAPIVLINGTFNIVHAGHCELFEFASRYGYLIVGTNSDRYVYAKYKRKSIKEEFRVKVLKSIKYIDKVILFEEDNACNLLKEIKPNYYIKGPDYIGKEFPEQEVCDNLGINIIYHKSNKILSSSKILNIF